MRSGTLLASALALGCASAAPYAPPVADPSRHALVERLCAPLPDRAFDCVVGWPASVPPARRSAVADASGGTSWAEVAGVRAYASCSDRPAEQGPAAHVVTLLVDPSAGTPEQISERLPVRVRWTEACEGDADACASYFAQAEGDRLVLTRRVQRPMGTGDDVARLACAAIADGAVEAHVRVDGLGPLLEALELGEAGVTTVARRPARGETSRRLRTWRELELGVMDDQLEHEADVRRAARERPMDPEDVDVANESVLDAQIWTRRRRLERDPSPAGMRALARLAERGFEAHPSRPDLAELAIDGWSSAEETARARAVLVLLRATLGDDDPAMADLGARIDALAGDAASLATRIARASPELEPEQAERVAGALVQSLETQARLSAEAWFALALRGMIAAARAERMRLPARATATLTPALGAAWALEAITGGTPVTLIAVCSDAALTTDVGVRLSGSRVRMVYATLDQCGAVVVTSPNGVAGALSESGLVTRLRGEARFFVEREGALVGLGGTLGSGDALRVTQASPSLARADLRRAQREVVEPLAATGGRVFPAPTLRIPLPPSRRAAALAGAEAIEGVRCHETAEGLDCTLESGEDFDPLAAAGYAAFQPD